MAAFNYISQRNKIFRFELSQKYSLTCHGYLLTQMALTNRWPNFELPHTSSQVESTEQENNIHSLALPTQMWSSPLPTSNNSCIKNSSHWNIFYYPNGIIKPVQPLEPLFVNSDTKLMANMYWSSLFDLCNVNASLPYKNTRSIIDLCGNNFITLERGLYYSICS